MPGVVSQTLASGIFSAYALYCERGENAAFDRRRTGPNEMCGDMLVSGCYHL